jgi:hypothetical protein
MSNTTEDHLTGKQQQQLAIDKYSIPGVYKLKCQICNKIYTGQMGHTFRTRYKEHVRAICYSIKVTSHILNTAHSYGPTEQTMEILQTVKKSHNLDTVERYYIHQHNHDNNMLNKAYTSMHNPIFYMLHKYYHPPPTNSPVQMQ